MPYMWVKPDEAEIIKRRRRADIPDKTAYYDTQKNAYICEDCQTALKEITRLTVTYATHLTILQCQECGRTFFGGIVRTLPHEEPRPAIKPEAPRKERREQSPKQKEEYIILPSIMTV